jgi:hypothetical protein
MDMGRCPETEIKPLVNIGRFTRKLQKKL